MKTLSKKICIYFLCTCLISASVFMSYENTISVYADDYDNLDMVQYWIYVAATIGGIASIPFSGGITLLGGLASAGGVLGVISGYDDYKNYVLDNGDGTFTMTPEFIQLVLDEAKKIEESGFHDYESIQNIDGTYNIAGYESYTSPDGTYQNVIFKDISLSKVIAVKSYSNSCVLESCSISGQSVSLNAFSCKYTIYTNGKQVYSGSSFNLGGVINSGIYGVNVPIFNSDDDAKSALISGDYSNALNYREKMFEYGSIYAPVYNGGSVTFRKDVLNGLEDKIKEVDEKYDNLDDKINVLTQYILGGGDSNGNSGSGFDFDFDIDSPFDLGELFNGLFNDWSDFGTSFVTSLADFFKELADGMKKKFPFSIPWDIYHIFTVFSNVDSPQAADISTISFSAINSGISVYTVDPEDLEQDVHDAPYFKLPIKVESFGIYEEIIVDMKDFQTLSTFSRTMFSLLFAVFLLKFTIKILSIFGVFGGGDD